MVITTGESSQCLLGEAIRSRERNRGMQAKGKKKAVVLFLLLYTWVLPPKAF